MKTIQVLAILLFLISCSEKEIKGDFLRVDKETLNYMIITDSLWDNYKVTEFEYKEYNFKHRYQYKEDTLPYKYSFILNGETKMIAENLDGDEGYKVGSSLHLLSKESKNDTTEIKVGIACPYISKDCLEVDILTTLNNGEIDTVQSKYKPTGDILLIEITNENVEKVNLITYLCGEELDKLKIDLF